MENKTDAGKDQRVVLNLNLEQAEQINSLLRANCDAIKNGETSAWHLIPQIQARIEKTITKHKISEKLGHKPSKEEMHTAMDVVMKAMQETADAFERAGRLEHAN